MPLMQGLWNWFTGGLPPNPLWQVGAQPSGLEGGSVRRRLAAFQPANVHVNALMRNAGPTMLARARYLVRNNGYARAAVRSWSAATVGAGIKPSTLVEEEDLKEAIHEAWTAWTDEADAEEVTDFYGITRRIAREAFLAGECFVRFRPRFPVDGLTVPLQLQIMPSEQLGMWPMEVVPTDQPFNAGGAIRMGIEFDRNIRDKRLAYWFHRFNPTDATIPFLDALNHQQLVRVPAEEVIHVFDPVEAGQLRGLTGYAAAITKIFHLDLYDESELERQKQQSRYATFVEQASQLDEQGNFLDPRPDDDPVGAFEPGASVLLYPGEKVTLSQPPGISGGYESFQFRVLLQICAALGIPYAELSADLSKATYASSRAGLLAFRTEVEAFQHAVLVFQFLRRVWQRWLDAAVLAGAIDGMSATLYNSRRAYYRRMQAIVPRAPWVDPLKDRQAIKLAMDSQVIAPQDAIEAEGYDIETVYGRIAEAMELRKKYGIPDAPHGWGSRIAPGTAPTGQQDTTSNSADTEAA